MAKSYYAYNGPTVTSAAPVPVTTGTAIKTLLQLAPAANFPLSVVEWGFMTDGSVAATPGKIELVDTYLIAATVTAFAAGDVMPFKDPNAAANTAGASGVPLNLGTALSGYTASAEGTVTQTRTLDMALIQTGMFIHQFPLGERPEVVPGHFLRVRVTFGTAVNALCYVVFEV